ncbi:hypothetical protein RB614_27535 [Phytohabitans sp. ZYX-F-186]|uniref:Lipoprotein n=1 Tax=Phytohabitans maris TaxID=3071409 RepID=A0ABU0ZPY0_9ACTN|nr:hypothetical protein [Phytohabitans sp. ZYX-F-186]MDQ7908285.1 hypothetical protein [Phytohabitans sp. ZYX-F-186]
MTVAQLTLARPRKAPWRAAAAVVAALFVAGCGSSGGGRASATGTATPAGTAVAASASPSPSVATASPSPAPRPTAADRRRYAACADGTCEVYVPRPVRIKVRGGTLAVTKVRRDDSLDFKLTFSTGYEGSGTLKGTCGSVVTFYRAGGGAGFTGCPAAGVPVRPTPQPGAQHMQLVGWSADGAAVLRLVSG